MNICLFYIYIYIYVYIYIYIYMSHFAVDLKLTHFKLNVLHLIKNKDNTDEEFYLNIS